MKLKKVLAVSLTAAMALGMMACGSNGSADAGNSTGNAATGTETADGASTDGDLTYANIVLGESYTDITTTIHVYNQRHHSGS